MKHANAYWIANDLQEVLAPHCQRLAIAGSLRRGKPEVKDIELVAVPKTKEIKDLFGIPTSISELEQFPWSLIGDIEKCGQRYKKLRLYDGIGLDIFIVLPPEIGRAHV